MAGLAAIAARIAALAPFLAHMSAPLGILNYSRVHYDIRAVNHSTGLGGTPPFCGPAGMDTIQVVYSVTNGNDSPMPATAVPRLVMIDPGGNVIQPDRTLTEMTALKTNPPMLLHNGVLASRESRVQADVFLVRKNAVTTFVYHLRPAPTVGEPIILPLSIKIETPECPETIQRFVAPDG